jgi:ABC-type dipeptide/oligopeptide/nickel transport system permease subunit
MPQVLDAFAYTIRLAAVALVLSVALGTAGGIVSAVRHRSAADESILTVTLLGISVPVFVTGLLLIYTFAFKLGWFPTSGAGTWRHLVLPACTLASFLTAYNVRMTRACMLEVLGQDYVRTARAKGVRELLVLGRHALRNALVPMVTVIGLQVGLLLGGSVITETVFGSGVGQLVVSAIGADTPLSSVRAGDGERVHPGQPAGRRQLQLTTRGSGCRDATGGGSGRRAPMIEVGETGSRRVWRALRRPRAAAGVIVLAALLAGALGADWLAPHDPARADLKLRLKPPSREYPLGTDWIGRCLLSRLLHGIRLTLAVGVVTVAAGVAVGVALGLLAGFYGGALETVIMRATDLLLAFPYFLLTIVFVAVLGPSLLNAMIAIAAWTAPHYVRLVRSVVLSVKGREFVEAARALGRPEFGILTRHILPACVPTLVVQAAIFCAQNMLMGASLSFLGLGAQPPSPELGAMLGAGRQYLRVAPRRSPSHAGHLPRRARLQLPRRRAPGPSRPHGRAGRVKKPVPDPRRHGRPSIP